MAVVAEGRLHTQPATLLSHDRVFRAPMLCVIGPCYNALREIKRERKRSSVSSPPLWPPRLPAPCHSVLPSLPDHPVSGCAGPDPPPITPFDSPHSTVLPCQLQNHLLSIKRRRKSLIISTNPFKRKTRFR
ncbi:hypothetical protein AOLI_G00089020 [Acnodon oligacanthus]